MNNLQIFNNAEFGNIRTVMIDGEPWFVGKDIATALGYSNHRDALAKHVDEEDKGVAKCDTLGGNQNLVIINESGLYALIFGSKLESTKRFKHWVTSEVLPSIRKNGFYGKQTESSTRFTAGMAEADVEAIVEKVTEKLLGKMPRNIFMEKKLAYEECGKGLYDDVDIYLIQMRKKELYKNVEIIATYYKFDYSLVLHTTYQELERVMGISLNAYKCVYQYETGRENASMVEVIVANDKLYKEAMCCTQCVIDYLRNKVDFLK